VTCTVSHVHGSAVKIGVQRWLPAIGAKMALVARKYGAGDPITPIDVQRIRAAVGRTGVPVRELALRVGLAPSGLYRILRGQAKSSAKLGAIYRALGLPVELVGRADPDEQELLDEYRRLKQALPHKVPDLISEVRSWADQAEKIRRSLDDAQEAEKSLGRRPPTS